MQQSKLRNTVALLLLYISSLLTTIGGLGDQFISKFLDIHLEYLGNPEHSLFLEKAEQLSMAMLHAAGGGLMAVGIGMLGLVHFGIREGQRWAMWIFLTIVWVAQGINALMMYSVGSIYWYPLSILILSSTGIISYQIPK